MKISKKNLGETQSPFGEPDASSEAHRPEWYDNIFVSTDCVAPAMSGNKRVIIGRKGQGKTAIGLAYTNRSQTSHNKEITATLSARNAATNNSSGYRFFREHGISGAVLWERIIEETYITTAATKLHGKLISTPEQELIRKALVDAKPDARDAIEKLGHSIPGIADYFLNTTAFDAASTLLKQVSQGVARRLANPNNTPIATIFIDDFDAFSSQINPSIENLRDAVEGAYNIYGRYKSRIRPVLLVRDDMWRFANKGWHFSDKVSGVHRLSWSESDLRNWTMARLKDLVRQSELISEDELNAMSFEQLWRSFFPQEIVLEDRDQNKSNGFSYICKRSFHSPRDIQRILNTAFDIAKDLPVQERDIKEAERVLLEDRCTFLANEFGYLCKNLDTCMRSFTGKPVAQPPKEMLAHLKSVVSSGEVTLSPGVFTGNAAEQLARCLFQAGFLEVRFRRAEGGFTYRDVFTSANIDADIFSGDGTLWAVRSMFHPLISRHSLQ